MSIHILWCLFDKNFDDVKKRTVAKSLTCNGNLSNNNIFFIHTIFKTMHTYKIGIDGR